MAAGPRPPLLDADLEAWRRLIRRRCGLDFGPSRRDYLARRLWRRMATAGAGNYGEYHHLALRQDEEWQELVELLITCETSFFRHRPSFDGLRHILRQRLTEPSGVTVGSAAPRGFTDPPAAAPSLRMWSAGCSTGQEPYSMAICAFDVIDACGLTTTVRVTGGDISPRARDLAARGRYSARQMIDLPTTSRRRHFQPLDPEVRGARSTMARGDVPTLFTPKPRLRQAVQLRHWNLCRLDTYCRQPQDVIFCQNLLIYLAPSQRPEVIRRLATCLAPGGHLFLAPGEVLALRPQGLESVRLPDCLVYRRTLEPLKDSTYVQQD